MGAILIAQLAALAWSCGNDAAPTAPSTTEIRLTGRVIDVRTDSGVAGAAVTIGSTRAVTDATGAYVMSLLGAGRYETQVNDEHFGTMRVTGPGHRGDILIGPRECGVHYGVIADALTLRPVAGALISWGGQSATTGPDGWYRLDFGCPAINWFRFVGTIFVSVSHPDYVTASQPARGVLGVSRRDIDLEPH